MSLPLVLLFENHWDCNPRLFLQETLPQLAQVGYNTLGVVDVLLDPQEFADKGALFKQIPTPEMTYDHKKYMALQDVNTEPAFSELQKILSESPLTNYS